MPPRTACCRASRHEQAPHHQNHTHHVSHPHLWHHKSLIYRILFYLRKVFTVIAVKSIRGSTSLRGSWQAGVPTEIAPGTSLVPRVPGLPLMLTVMPGISDGITVSIRGYTTGPNRIKGANLPPVGSRGCSIRSMSNGTPSRSTAVIENDGLRCPFRGFRGHRRGALSPKTHPRGVMLWRRACRTLKIIPCRGGRARGAVQGKGQLP